MSRWPVRLPAMAADLVDRALLRIERAEVLVEVALVEVRAAPDVALVLTAMRSALADR